MERRYGGGVDAWLAERIKESTEAVTAERDALAAILAEAPHGSGCDYWGRTGPFTCNCWKSKLPADALAARDAEKWDEGFTSGNYGRNPYRIEREAQ